VAIDETDLSTGSVGGKVDSDDVSDAAVAAPVDDFRLRLDSPLFHRDPGMTAAAQAPLLRELTWEHVVRPASQQVVTSDDPDPVAAENERAARTTPLPTDVAPTDLVPGLKPVQPALSIESLLEQARERSAAPVDGVAIEHDQQTMDELDEAAARIAAAPEPTVPRVAPLSLTISGEIARRDAPSLPVRNDSVPLHGAGPGAIPSAELPTLAAASAAAAGAVTVTATGPGGVAATRQASIGSLLAALEQMDAAEAQYVPVVTPEQYVVPAHASPEYARVAEPVVPQPELLEHHQTAPDVQSGPVPTPAAEQRITGESAAVVPAAVARAVSVSAVEAELNRLAFLPDHEDVPGPVEVPAIVHSDVPSAPPVPSLSSAPQFTPRATAPTHPRTSFLDLAGNFTPPPRKKQRHVLRRLVTLVLVLSIIGGGLFAAKYYLLDKRWEGDVKEMVAEVEEARQLSFDHAITVSALPIDEYATQSATLSLGLTDANSAVVGSEWRALGLLSGPLDPKAIGMASLADAPAFYDPASETVFVAAGLPTDLRRFALQRALTLALLDQEYGWADRLKDSSAAVAHGTRALYDADALATATSLVDPTERASLVLQLFGLYTTYQIPAAPSPFASAVVGRLGLAMAPYVASVPVEGRDDVLVGATITDGQALDLRRLVSGLVEAPAATSRGMLYWYHVLAARLDSNTAWQAALAWGSDDVSVVGGLRGSCVTANITVDPAAVDGVTRAFQQWAAAGPAESQATVISAATGQVRVNSCDPGLDIATNDGRSRLSLGGGPLRAEQYRQLVAAQPTLPANQLACAVYGGDAVLLSDERGIIDGVAGWPAPATHAAPDPNRLGCVSG